MENLFHCEADGTLFHTDSGKTFKTAVSGDKQPSGFFRGRPGRIFEENKCLTLQCI